MDTNQPASPVTYAPASSAPGMFGTKIPSTVAFVIGILLFLLPFTEIRCGGTKLMSKSGLDFALDNQWKTVAGGLPTGDTSDTAMNTGKEQKGNTQYFIIGALALGVIGLLLSLGGAKGGGAGSLVAGVAGAGALIGFMMDLKNNFANSLREQAIDSASKGADDAGLGKVSETMGDLKPTLAFTPWFYIAVLAFLAAAIFGYMRMRSPRT